MPSECPCTSMNDSTFKIYRLRNNESFRNDKLVTFKQSELILGVSTIHIWYSLGTYYIYFSLNPTLPMQEHIRALIVIILMALIGFAIAKKLAPKGIMPAEINRWRNLWLAVVIAAFVAHNFWIYLILSGIFIFLSTTKDQNKMALFFILLFVIPPLEIQVPGFGLVNYLFALNHPRFITLIVLLPAALAISQKNNFKFTKIWADKFLLLYILLIFGLGLRDTTLTDALRLLFYSFTDIFLPYFVASRAIKDLSNMRTVLYAFVTSAVVLAFIAIFESGKQWLLYNQLGVALGTGDSIGNYLGRSGGLRAIASLGHPIILGYFMTIAIGFYLYLTSTIQNKSIKKIGAILLGLGLFVPLSRGPWVGALAMFVTYLALGPSPIKKLGTLFIVGIFSLPILAMLPGGGKIMELIPFVGQTEKGNIEYREQLFENALIVIKNNLFFGSSNYLETPEMQAMIQGEGIVDVVNTYLSVALDTGIVGLSLFVGVFLAVVLGVRKKLKRIKDYRQQQHLLGRSLLAIIVSMMVTIATVSSIATVAIIYWSILGIGVAYTRIPEGEL